MSDPRKAVTERWRTGTSAAGLTWELMLDGDAILAAVGKHAPLDAARILEIGPGYGRLLRSLVNSPIPFASYVGLDISEHWVGELATEFRGRANIEFVCGAAEQADALLVGRHFDVIVSMLTWKHFYPDFTAVAYCCRRLLAPAGRIIFDLPETGVAWPIQADSQTGAREETGTFTRAYTRPAIETLLLTAGLSVAAFDEIIHAPGKRRLLVIAVPAG